MYVESTDLLLIACWNSNNIEVVDSRPFKIKGHIDVSEYAPYAALEIDLVQSCMINHKHHLFISLRNGMLLILNLYLQVFDKDGIEDTQAVRLQSARHCSFLKLQKLSSQAACLVCEDTTYIAS